MVKICSMLIYDGIIKIFIYNYIWLLVYIIPFFLIFQKYKILKEFFNLNFFIFNY